MKIKSFILAVLCAQLLAQDSFVGVVKPLHDIKLSLSTDGIVHELFVKEGTVVKKGDPLIKLDDRLQNLETQRRKLIYEDNSKLDSAEAENKILKSLFNSTKQLYEKTSGVSKDELQSLEIKLQSSNGELSFLKESKKKELIEHKIAKELLDQYTLYSPINAQVTKLNIDLGEFVKNTEPIISIVDSSKCFVELNIDKEHIHKIKKEQIVKISSNLKESNVTKEAKIIFISPIADRSSGLFFVKAEFENKNLEILPGLTVNVVVE